MRAIILAAGRGSRMGNLTNEIPKCLIKVRGKALLDWQIDALKSAGLNQLSVVTGYKRELISSRGLREFHNRDWATTNMLASLMCAEEWLSQEECIISYSDIFFEASAVDALIRSKAPLAITYDPDWLRLWSKRFSDPLDDAETFQIDKNECLVTIGEKPQSLSDVAGQYMGLLRFTPVGFAELRRSIASLSIDQLGKIHLTGVLKIIVDAGRLSVKAIPYRGVWGEVDSEEDLKLYDPSWSVDQ
jgi:L-glutamine-phosphate cytidylyltransferase